MSLDAEEMDEALKLGRLACNAFRAFAEDFSSAPTEFEDLPVRIQRAWAFTANTVCIHHTGVMLEIAGCRQGPARLRDLTRFWS